MISGRAACCASSRRAPARPEAVSTEQDQPSSNGRIAANTEASLSMQSTSLPESAFGTRRAGAGRVAKGTAAPTGRLTENTLP